MRRLAFILTLWLTGAITALAHDPYEITSVVYLQSNRIQLIVEMEFPTAMTLAEEKTSRDVSAASQFEGALPQLEKLAGGFFEITAGNNAVLPLRTNVQLGVEDHIHCKVEFAPTDYRPLRFVPRGLHEVVDSPYGISLTVLDMVNKKVLGQATLFADSLAADFPVTATNPRPAPLASPALAVARPEATNVLAAGTSRLPRPEQAGRPPRETSFPGIAIFALVGILLVAWRLLNPRS